VIGQATKLGYGLGVEVDAEVYHRVRLTVDDVEAAGSLAVRLAPRRLARLESAEEALPEGKLGVLLKGLEHRVCHPGIRHHIRRHDDVPGEAVAGPGLVL